MERDLEDILTISDNALERLRALVDVLRSSDGEAASPGETLQKIVVVLRERDDMRAAWRAVFAEFFMQRRAVLLFATSGIYPETGVISETFRRMSNRILPEPDGGIQMQDAVRQIFRSGDARWLTQISPTDWIDFVYALHFDELQDPAPIRRLVDDLLESLRFIAHKIAGASLEPEMLRLDPSLEEHASSFLALCAEALNLADSVQRFRDEAEPMHGDEKHLMVLLEQSYAAIERVRRRAQQNGASFHLTFHLRRLFQSLKRLEELADIVAAIGRRAGAEAMGKAAILGNRLVVAESSRNKIWHFWQRNADLMALRITENAGRSGEHYITVTRSDYFAMVRSAIGGGVIIALMAASKLLLSMLHFAPLTEVIVFSLNYGLGFVLIHILGFTVATKQPAMTANAIAAAVGENQEGKRPKDIDLEPLVTLVAQTTRTQLAAILGNIGLAIPCAMALAYVVYALSGQHFVMPDKAGHLLAQQDPIHSGAVLYAGIAGVCLFLAGLIAGYFDNFCTYNRIPQRLLQLSIPARLFGPERWAGIVRYVENNLGAIAGNFFFGLMLGGAAGLGTLLGLPLDIRHIAFSAAYIGYALIALNFHIPLSIAALGVLGVLTIGLTNLAVSFYLAIRVGLRARGLEFVHRKRFMQDVLRRLRNHPREFLLPPRTDQEADVAAQPDLPSADPHAEKTLEDLNSPEAPR